MEDPTPTERAPRTDGEPDLLVGEIHRERRHRGALVVSAVVGIITGVAAGTAFLLGAFGDAARGAPGARSPAALIFFLGPPIACMAIGYAIFALLRRRR